MKNFLNNRRFCSIAVCLSFHTIIARGVKYNTTELLSLRPGNPGLDDINPPRNHICPQTIFEPTSPKGSLRYGSYKYVNTNAPVPVHWCTTSEGCSNTVPLDDDGYIDTVSPDRGSSRYEITQIIPSALLILYVEKDLWICWKAPHNTTVALTSGTPDTKILLYAGCGCSPETSPLIGCVDGKDVDAEGHHYSKKLIWDTIEQHDYLIRFGTSSSDGLATGDVEFHIENIGTSP